MWFDMISIMRALRTIYCNTHVYTFHVCLCLLALTFVCNSAYLLTCSFQIYRKSIVVFIRSLKIWFKTTSCANNIHVCLARLSLPQALHGCIINIYVILGRRNLFEMGAVRSICSRIAICCVGLAARNFGNGRVVLWTWETIIASSGLQLL